MAAMPTAIAVAQTSPPRATPRTSSTPVATATTPAVSSGVGTNPVATAAVSSTSTGARPRAIGYTSDISERR